MLGGGLVGCVEVVDVLQIALDGFEDVECRGAAGAVGKSAQAVVSGIGQMNGGLLLGVRLAPVAARARGPHLGSC